MTVSNNLLLPQAETRLLNFNTHWKMKWWMFQHLPSALFMGVSIREVTPEKAIVSLPYGWRSQNPFHSIYFAAQCAAAEMSTGLLATLAIAGRGKISMLVSHIECEFTKKANQLTTFICEDGSKVFAVVEKAIQTGVPQQLTMISVGRQASGEVVSTTRITWSFKYKPD